MDARQRVTEAYMDSREEVYRYLLTFGLPPAHAQDAAQEVYLRMFSTLKQGEDILNPRAWAFRVAHNIGLKAKMRERRMEPLGPVEENTFEAEGVSPERALLDAERLTLLAGALETLSPQQRQCLHLRAEGLRYREIAEIIGIRISTVSVFVARALARLRKAVHD